MDLRCRFVNVPELFEINVKSNKDVDRLLELVIEDQNGKFRELAASIGKDSLLVDEILHLLDKLRNLGHGEFENEFRNLVYLVVQTCLSQEDACLSSIVVERLKAMGYLPILADSLVKFYFNLVGCDEVEEFVISRALGSSDSSLFLCSIVLRYLTKYISVVHFEGEYLICVDSIQCYNAIRRVIGVMFGSCLKVGDRWDVDSLSKMFHPFSKTYLPSLIQYMVVDLLPNEPSIELLELLASFYSDLELRVRILLNELTYLAGTISRLLFKTRVSREYSFGTLSNQLERGITIGMSTLDPVIRLTSMTVAESYSIFLYNNAEIKDDSILLKFEKEFQTDSPNILHLKAYKSDVKINQKFKNEVASSREGREDDEGCQDDRDENNPFLELVFESVPEFRAKTVDGCFKETHLKPPQYLMQCYERLLPRSGNGQMDYQYLAVHSLHKPGGKTVGNEVLKVSQTLLYLPEIINRKENMFEMFSVPLSNLLLKMDDLDMYKETIEEIVNKLKKGPISEIGREEVRPPQFISKDPEILVMVSLVLIAYHSPLQMTKFYSEHLFDTGYTPANRITMLLCIHYSAIAINSGFDGETLAKKVLYDNSKDFKKELSIENLRTFNLMSEGKKTQLDITLYPKDGYLKLGGNGTITSGISVKNFNNQAISLLLDSLKIYKVRKEEGLGPMDEDIAVGIFETILVLISNGLVDEEVLKDLRNMVEILSVGCSGQRFRTTLEMVVWMLCGE